MNGLSLARDQVRRIDALAIERLAVPGIVLMENAARQVADHAIDMLVDDSAPRDVLVICGGGNNGGDGFAAARHLHTRGVGVTLATTKPREAYTGDAATNYDACVKLGLLIVDANQLPAQSTPCDLIIDALLGTGLTRDVQPPIAELIEWINTQPAPKLAVDLPSGLDCDRGVLLGVAVRAARTVTFVARKRGFENPGSRDFTGEVHVADIGVPPDLFDRFGG
jgi:hydroxyethylthiazole kinase-like uncharacterized protein yjeF